MTFRGYASGGRGPPVTPKTGQTFYESPGDIHTVAKNASQAEKAKFVVFFLKDKGTPTFLPVKYPSTHVV